MIMVSIIAASRASWQRYDRDSTLSVPDASQEDELAGPDLTAGHVRMESGNGKSVPRPNGRGSAVRPDPAIETTRLATCVLSEGETGSRLVFELDDKHANGGLTDVLNPVR